MFDQRENYKISRDLASGGMILLKNEDKTLPLKAQSRVGVVGKECLRLLSGGGGSSRVKCEYVRSLKDGLLEKAAESKLGFYEPSLTVAAETEEYTVELLNRLAENMDTAIVTFRRHSFEGADRKIGKEVPVNEETGAYVGETDDNAEVDDYEVKVGYYYPSKRELDLFSALESSDIDNVVLILNISAIVDISFIEKFKKIKSVLLCYMPGMESGTAIADVLCGDVNPSGRLVDTVAYDIKDWPSTEYFDYDEEKTEYKEGIFVGYRYFETHAKDRVMYPFGYGLSYTEFEFSDPSMSVENGRVKAAVTVKNIGGVPGREVVQIYSAPPAGKLEKPAVELRGFAKTRELASGESETVSVEFALSDMACFDSTGVTGFKAAWVLEQGGYGIFAAKNVRELYSCGTYFQKETEITKQLTLRFDREDYNKADKVAELDCRLPEKPVSLYDVEKGSASLEEFVAQLTSDELIELAMGQPPAFPCGTAGIGNLKKYGVPNSQTADGPAGVRRSINSTCFPCETLIASSWDKELQFAMGKAMGYEAYSTGIDVLLAPGLNIHRNPLCGRSFEYFSEDPLVSGKTAAAIVNGIQSEGLCATVKHFAANNCEFMRRSNNSIVDERTLREIYLKGFEIAVKESRPAYVMSSYNKLNGHHASANAALLRGILREEWGYEGCVMTDWRNCADLDDELIAGNNIKMPYGYPDQIAKAKKAYESGKLSLGVLQENAVWVLRSVMKTRCFIQHDFGFKHKMTDGVLSIPAIETDSISSTRAMQEKREDGVWYLYRLNKDQRGQRTFVNYSVEVSESGDYKISAEISTNFPAFEIWYENSDGKKLAKAICSAAPDQTKWYNIDAAVRLQKGENLLKMVFADEPDREYEPLKTGFFPTGENDIRFAGLKIESI